MDYFAANCRVEVYQKTLLVSKPLSEQAKRLFKGLLYLPWSINRRSLRCSLTPNKSGYILVSRDPPVLVALDHAPPRQEPRSLARLIGLPTDKGKIHLGHTLQGCAMNGITRKNRNSTGRGNSRKRKILTDFDSS